MSEAPFIGDEILDDAIKVATEKGNSILENPCFRCMGSHDTDEYSTTSVLRETITRLNTPQTFHYGELLELYERAGEDGVVDELEPHATSIYYHYKKTLYFSKDSQLDIKITSQDALDLFEAFCVMKEQRRQMGLKQILCYMFCGDWKSDAYFGDCYELLTNIYK